MIILGAGLSGLIAATQLPNATVVEANDRAALSHKAVLRFRSDALSRLTGIPFRKVTVRKSIWMDGSHRAVNLELANLYSYKTNGKYLDRSIWNLDPVERFIAPEDLAHQMVDLIGDHRFRWNECVTPSMLEGLVKIESQIISTIPLPKMLSMLVGGPLLEWHGDIPKFDYKGINVSRYRVPGADVFQTVYYPSPELGVYRASMTGDLLIIEGTRELTAVDTAIVATSFGMREVFMQQIDSNHSQRFGKIAPVDDRFRRNAIFRLTQELGIYSLGRFAIWSNVLLDDVVKDVAVIKRMIAHGKYGSVLQHHKGSQ